jgi:cation:H+ antiporter
VTVSLYDMSCLFLASVIIALGGCTLFTNGIEWLGKRLKVPEGAIGSIFAGVGTALPETTIPVIAIFFGTGQEQTDVGLGAILGAPFMLSTLALPILAGLLVFCARMGKRKSAFVLNYQEVRIDLLFFSDRLWARRSPAPLCRFRQQGIVWRRSSFCCIWFT